METHAHELHKAPSHGWKHYFFEFLMLFLAVFGGFLAEYQLEHRIEKEREREYIVSMINDIIGDTSGVAKTYKYHITRLTGFDSLLKVVYQTPYSDSSLNLLYYLNRKYIIARTGFEFTKRTIIQLKNAGGLRLIRNQAASDSIIVYDQRCERIEFQMENDFVPIINDKVMPLVNKIFDMHYMQQYKTFNDFHQANIHLTFLNKDEKMMREYANWVYLALGYLKKYTLLLKEHEERSLRLILLLKKEYHLQ